MPRASLRLAGAALALCCCLAPGAAAAPLRVVVSIPPLAWFAERALGPDGSVTVLLGPGDSPHTWEPSPQDVARLSEADLFVCAGIGFERGLRGRIAAMPRAPRVCGPLPPTADGHGHDHHGHDHGDDDPHTWLGPTGAAAIADTIVDILGRLRPELRPALADRRAALQAAIDAADADARRLLAGREGGTFVVFHPAFGHFAEAYGLHQLALEDEGHEPGARRLAEVTAEARAAGAGAVAVQPQNSRRASEAVAASLGVPVVTLDPLARDWAANYVAMARTLAAVLPPAAAPEARP